MRFTCGYASIWCILLQQLQLRDSMAPITRGVPNGNTPYVQVASPFRSIDYCEPVEMSQDILPDFSKSHELMLQGPAWLSGKVFDA